MDCDEKIMLISKSPANNFDPQGYPSMEDARRRLPKRRVTNWGTGSRMSAYSSRTNQDNNYLRKRGIFLSTAHAVFPTEKKASSKVVSH